jgi:hypothetical protein
MNPQEIFDTVATHLFTQGKRAGAFDQHMSKFMCKYRAPDGTKCAAGVLIPDEAYFPGMEGEGISNLCGDPSIKLPPYILANVGLLSALQEAHDLEYSWSSTAHMSVELRFVADRFHLNTDILNNLSFAWENKEA